jgi:hypothetical protein
MRILFRSESLAGLSNAARRNRGNLREAFIYHRTVVPVEGDFMTGHSSRASTRRPPATRRKIDPALDFPVIVEIGENSFVTTADRRFLASLNQGHAPGSAKRYAPSMLLCFMSSVAFDYEKGKAAIQIGGRSTMGNAAK